MNTFLFYIIQSGCYLLLFYLGYKALLSRDTFFSFNRKVLIGGMLACLLLPLVEIKTEEPSVFQQPFVKLDLLLTEEVTAPYRGYENFVTTPAFVQIDKTKTNPALWLGCIYLSGLFIVALLSLKSFGSLLFFLRKGRKIKEASHTFVLTGEPVVPFNWGRYIVMSEVDYKQEAQGILLHEQAHLKKGHSLDLVFVELLLLLHWFNPVVWLLRRELRSIHEYEADNEVLNSGIDATKYQLLLLKKAVSSRSYTFANSFNQSKLKNRITMMLKKKSNRQARWKLLLLVPMAAFAMYAFARPGVNRHLQQLIPSEDTTIKGDSKSFTRHYFESRFDTYYEQTFGKNSLSSIEKFDRLKEQSQIVPVLINAENRIMVEHALVSVEEFRPTLESIMSAGKLQEKSLLFYFLTDRGTSHELVEWASATLGIIAEKFSSKDLPVLVYWDNGLRYPPQKSTVSEGSVRVKAYDIDKKNYTIHFNVYDSYDVLKEKLSALSVKNLEIVEVSANPNTPMGIVTDIKSIIREMYYSAHGKAGYGKLHFETVF